MLDMKKESEFSIENVSGLSVDEQYLVKPFNANLERIMADWASEKTSSNVMNILIGGTGLGKTYNTAMNFIPQLFRNGLKFIIMSFPMTEIIDDDTFEDACHGENAYGENFRIAKDIATARRLLRKGKKVLFIATNQYLGVFCKTPVVDLVKEVGYENTGIFVDEAHTWLISSWKRLQEVAGNANNEKYKATLYNLICKIAEKSPYVFGLTATPNLEMIPDGLQAMGTMKFEIINEFAPTHRLYDRVAAMGDANFFTDDTCNNMFDISILNTLKSSQDGTKKSQIIYCEQEKSSVGWDDYYSTERVVEMLRNSLSHFGLAKDCEAIAVLTCDEKRVYTVGGTSYVETEQEIKDRMSNHDDELQFLVVIRKARMGMNISTLKTMFVLQPTNKKNDVGPVTTWAVQMIGRLVRLNSKQSIEGYSLQNLWNTLQTSKEKKMVLDSNTFDIYVPENEMWREAHTEFLSHYTNTRDGAFQLLEHNGVLCTSLECPAGDDCPYQKPENSNILGRIAAKMQLDKFLNIA